MPSAKQLGKAWRQLARWLVADVPARVQIESQPLVEDAQGSVTLTVRVRDARFKPVEDAAVTIEVEPVLFAGDPPEDPTAIRLRAEPVPGEPGAYALPYVPRRNGGFRARAVVLNETERGLRRAETGWSTDLAADEFRSLAPNVALLEEASHERPAGGRGGVATRRVCPPPAGTPGPGYGIEGAAPLAYTRDVRPRARVPRGQVGVRRWKGLP